MGIFKKPGQEQIVLLITLALLVIFSVTLDGFATVGNILNLMRSVSILGILGLGMGLVVITRGIDLSIIAIMAGSWVIALISFQSGLPIGWTVGLSILVAMLIGFFNGAFIAYVEAPALFVTFSVSLVVYGLAFWLAPVWVVYAPTDHPALLYWGQGHLLGVPMAIVVFAIACVVLHFVLSRTSLGLFFYAQGDNPSAARLSGISLRPLTVFTYVIAALLAWLAGLVWIGSTGSMQMQTVQGPMIFDVILVVVLGGISLVGGRGGVLSVIAGCALIGTLLNAFTIMDINSEVQSIIRGVVLLSAILLDNRLHPRDEETARQGD